MDDLDALRKGIASIDEEIIALVAKRMEVARSIGMAKREMGKAIRDIPVEERVVERFISAGKELGISRATAEQVCRAVIREAVEVQSMIPHEQEGRRILIVGGSGKMGRWLRKFLAERGHEVRYHDLVVSTDGAYMPLEEGVEWSEVIIIATPISEVGPMLERLIEYGADRLVFDISSLKSPFVGTLREAASRGHRYCSVHPMFGPDTRSVFDRRILLCDCGSPSAVEEARTLMEGGGALLVDVRLEEHDLLMSYVLGLSHAVNIVFFNSLARSGIPFDRMMEVASTTLRKQLDTTIDVAMENPYLYYEIQSMNANSEGTWHNFHKSVEDVMNTILDGDEAAFIDIMKAGRAYFGGR